MRLLSISVALHLLGTTIGSALDGHDTAQHALSGPLLDLAGRKQPNIIFILTDDQDLHMNSLDYMPFLKEHLIDKGTLFKKHFCTTAICCPAR